MSDRRIHPHSLPPPVYYLCVSGTHEYSLWVPMHRASGPKNHQFPAFPALTGEPAATHTRLRCVAQHPSEGSSV